MDKLTLISDREMKAINNAQPPEAKYGDVFKAIAQAQLDDIQNRQLPEIMRRVRVEIEKQIESYKNSSNECPNESGWWQSFWEELIGGK